MRQRAPETEARRRATSLRNLLRLQAVVLGSAAIVAALGPSALAAVVLAVVAVDVLFAATLRARRLLALAVALAGLQLVVLGAGAAAVVTGDAGIARSVLALLVVDGLVLVALQARAARRARRALENAPGVAEEAPPIETMELSRGIAAGVAPVWRAVTDARLYARLALNLGAVEPMSFEGAGATRHCTDVAGRSWSETCTLWDDGRAFAVEVDTSDYPYPLDEMRGHWWVEPDGDASVAGMTFEVRPRRGMRGALFVAVMQAGFRPVVSRILRGWGRAASAARATSARTAVRP